MNLPMFTSIMIPVVLKFFDGEIIVPGLTPRFSAQKREK